MTRKEIDEQTREDWRELGFFYDQDKDARVWRLFGSQTGLLKFVTILKDYVADERNATVSEHDHYGPYWYLKIVTWDEPLITEHDIRGAFDDLMRLAELTRAQLENAQPGDVFEIDKEYAANNEFKLRFEVREDGFDPAEPDPLWYPRYIGDRSFISRIWHKLLSS